MKIILKGYTVLNLGDDLFFKIIAERYPNVKFKFLCRNYNKLLRGIKTTNLLSITLFEKIMDKIIPNYIKKNVDTIVEIGGSLFIEETNPKNLKKREKELKKELEIVKNNCFILGANFGPYKTKEYVEKFREIFLSYKDICFRDEKSKKIFSDLKNVRVAPDIVFQLKVPKLDKNEKIVVVSVIKPSYRKGLENSDENYYKKIIEISDEFLSLDYKVVLMSFCKIEKDEEAVNFIYEKLKRNKNVEKYFYSGNIEEALNIINKSEYVIATRFHAMILALVMKKACFPIIYSEKMLTVLNDIKFEGKNLWL